jgi:hypothetical protein|tara:strand:+ start:107 stop:289 length:183 start_codon:yes stop_codon:yes gene_type:complete
MVNICLEDEVAEAVPAKTTNETAYLASMMPEVRQEGYTCVSGCQDCCSCGGNDYAPAPSK